MRELLRLSGAGALLASALLLSSFLMREARDYDFGPVIVTLWGRNLTDTKYNTFAVQSSAAGGTRYFAQRANPLQFGLDVNIHL